MGDVLVLCYHAVSDRWPAPLSVTPRALEEQLRLLVKRGYRGATFTEAATGESRGRTLVVTFDDAFHSVGELARPILDRLGLPATVFVPSDYPAHPSEPMAWPGIDRWVGGEFEADLRPHSWEELADLAAAGWEVGSHTCSHPHLTELEDGALSHELVRSKSVCEERLGRPCTSLAYPYGDWDERVEGATGRAGYVAACTLPSRLHEARPLSFPRVGIYHGDDRRRYRMKVSPLVRRIRASPLWTRA